MWANRRNVVIHGLSLNKKHEMNYQQFFKIYNDTIYRINTLVNTLVKNTLVKCSKSENA